MRKISRVAQVLLGALALAVAAVTPAYASPNAPATNGFTIHSAASSSPKCVGLANNGSTDNGTPLVLWDCHYHVDQYWYGTNPLLRSTASGFPNGKCVGLANNGSTSNGTWLVLWDCHGHPDQQWAWTTLSDGTYALTNPPSGKCVGLANNGSTANGTLLVLWDCHLNIDQHWTLGS
jgi:hypothetical protein